MSRTRMALVAIALAACTRDPDPISGAEVVATVTGGTEHSFFEGELRRRVTFSARRHADGAVDGQFVVALLTRSSPAAEPRQLGDPIHYQVTCLVIEGNRAWIGGRIVGRRDDPYAGGEDVWYVEAGTAAVPDRAALWVGRASGRCTERSPATGLPSERGAIVLWTLHGSAHTGR